MEELVRLRQQLVHRQQLTVFPGKSLSGVRSHPARVAPGVDGDHGPSQGCREVRRAAVHGDDGGGVTRAPDELRQGRAVEEIDAIFRHRPDLVLAPAPGQQDPARREQSTEPRDLLSGQRFGLTTRKRMQQHVISGLPSRIVEADPGWHKKFRVVSAQGGRFFSAVILSEPKRAEGPSIPARKGRHQAGRGTTFPSRQVFAAMAVDDAPRDCQIPLDGMNTAARRFDDLLVKPPGSFPRIRHSRQKPRLTGTPDPGRSQQPLKIHGEVRF